MSAYAEIADALAAIITLEFEPEKFVPVHDRLHESVGHDRTRIGISLDSQVPQTDNMLVLDTTVLVQFYGRYKLDVDPDQKVDPRLVAARGERLMAAIRDHQAVPTNSFWYFNLSGIDYPSDPTGNKTRFEATVVAKAANPALHETS